MKNITDADVARALWGGEWHRYQEHMRKWCKRNGETVVCPFFTTDIKAILSEVENKNLEYVLEKGCEGYGAKVASCFAEETIDEEAPLEHEHKTAPLAVCAALLKHIKGEMV